ncbi:expressed unknown protein [Seminavis robusta]|uniref:Uncharacterized protein n=1 Tax=Seminavis robusta TaxID=568900 RepID=A0A9N8HTI4_9STRA|nr:expressed unknown protein [Seminavis robusta]|eukprot:Sro1278_g258750.1 n/a (417) ;mRNA; f:4586-5836
MPAKGEIKRRKKTSKSKEASNNNASKSESSSDDRQSNTKNEEAENVDDSNDKSPIQVFLEHPLVVVLPWFAIPYLLYNAYFFLQLQRPDFLEPFGISLRPPVGVEDPRQVLIVGSMSSGTMQVQHDLTTLLQLEIGHESSNSQTEFVRDGTVSWIHVMRYLEPPKSKEGQITAHENLCQQLTPQMGFHPAMYRPSQLGCSTRQTWNSCWSQECSQIIQREWGCALPNTPQTCQTPFRKVLHQVRHPLRTIESLVVKFCQGGLDGDVSPSFQKFRQALFPGRHYSPDHSCIEAAAHYVLAYHHALLTAQAFSLIDAMFQVESSSPCDMARLAGFIATDQEAADVVYPPNAEKVTRICATNENARAIMTPKTNKINVGLVSLQWEDLRGGKHGSVRETGDTSLEVEVRALVQKLGYEE